MLGQSKLMKKDLFPALTNSSSTDDLKHLTQVSMGASFRPF